jgi:hypothetical protein
MMLLGWMSYNDNMLKDKKSCKVKNIQYNRSNKIYSYFYKHGYHLNCAIGICLSNGYADIWY